MSNRKQSLRSVHLLNYENDFSMTHTFVIMQTNEVNRFFDHLNNVDLNINFTIELEQDDKLAFLDVLVMRMQDGKLATKVHPEITHTNRYLNYHSAHSSKRKQGVVMNLYNRAQSLITKSTDWKKRKKISISYAH